MSAANDKSSKEATGLVVELPSPNKNKANGPNNYLAWAGAMRTTMGERYDPMTRVFNDQVLHVVPVLEAADVSQADDPGMEGLFGYQPQRHSSIGSSRPRDEEKIVKR